MTTVSPFAAPSLFATCGIGCWAWDEVQPDSLTYWLSVACMAAATAGLLMAFFATHHVVACLRCQRATWAWRDDRFPRCFDCGSVGSVRREPSRIGQRPPLYAVTDPVPALIPWKPTRSGTDISAPTVARWRGR